MTKRYFTSTALWLISFLMIHSASQAQQLLHYDFKNTMNEKSGSGPALNILGTGAFFDDALTDLSCIERPLYYFDANSGVQFDNGAAGNFFANSYSIEMYFAYDNNNGFFRVIDFKNRTSDFGLYATSSTLVFYDELTVGTTAFGAGQFVHLVVTRDGLTDEVSLYVNGSQLGSFTDTNGEALTNASNVLNFFQDDLIFGGEAQPGDIALLKIYDYPLTATNVTDLFTGMEATSGVVAFSPDITSACLTGNNFVFTNESGNSGNVTYSWEFGDGNTATGTNASHSYAAANSYLVWLIADDGAGCTDTAYTVVLVNSEPVVNLGGDLEVCDGDSVILNPGGGYVSYLWNTGSTNPNEIFGQAGIYSIVVVDTNGCAGTDTLEISYLPPVVVGLGSDSTYCFGETVNLSAAAGFVDYLWSTGETTQDISVVTGGTYTVEVIDADGCEATDSITVSYYSEIITSLPDTVSACIGTTVTLDPGQTFVSYLWSDLSTAATLDVTASGNYTVTVTDSNGCSASATSIVGFDTPAVVTLGNDTTICGGFSLLLDAGSGYTSYLWSNAQTTQSVSITTAGTYWVEVTLAPSACPGRDTIVVTTDPAITLGNDITICQGDTSILDPVVTYTTYLWSTGTTSPTLPVTMAGTYTLTVTDINGCINSDEINVTVNPSPVVDLGSDIDLCDGESVTLDAGSGFFDYLWSNGSANQTINVSQQGTYTVTVTDLLGCSAFDEINITVNPLPVVNLGPDFNLCPGTGTVLDGGPGMSSYLWSDGSTGQLLLISTDGTYTITVTDSVGCINTDTITVGMWIAPVVTLLADTTLCDGETLVIDAGPGFAGYAWNTGETTQSISVTQANLYTVTVTDANGCTGWDDVQVDFYAPVAVPTITQNLNTLVSSAATGNQWYSVPGGLIPGATGNTYEPGQNGTYYVIVTDSNGCQSAPSPDYIFVFDGIAENPGLSFALYPNPTSEVVTIAIPAGIISGEWHVELFDLNGKVVLHSGNISGDRFRLNAGGMGQGVYYLRVISSNGTGVKKLIISR